MKKRFILLIDFSKYSANLIRYASEWCGQINAELLLIHQTTVLSPALSNYEVKQEITQHTNNEALKELRKLAQEIVPSTIKVSFWVSESHLNMIIPAMLTEPFDHLVFIGIKEAGLLKQIFLGSTAVEVIDGTDNIVIAMPKEISTFSHKKIFIAVTEKHPLNIGELDKFLGFIDPEDTELTFFYLAKPFEETANIQAYLSELSQSYADQYHSSFSIFEGSKPFEDIKEVINDKIDEILVIQKGSRFLNDQYFRKFLINELIYHGQTPMIVLP